MPARPTRNDNAKRLPVALNKMALQLRLLLLNIHPHT